MRTKQETKVIEGLEQKKDQLVSKVAKRVEEYGYGQYLCIVVVVVVRESCIYGLTIDLIDGQQLLPSN